MNFYFAGPACLSLNSFNHLKKIDNVKGETVCHLN